MKPLVTIVTVTYNAGLCLEETILSVLNQKDIAFEYVLIDGGSNDNTLELIQKYASQITYWESKPDNGIYDAMNKSLHFVNGIWVCFMNAGDKFYNEYVLSDLFKLNSINDFNVIYGNYSFTRKSSLIIKYPKPLTSIWKFMPICHQSIFAKSNLLKDNPFDLKYKFAADYNFIYQTYLNYKKTFLYINKTISHITTGGFSESNSIATYIEYRDISLKLNYGKKVQLYFNLKLIERNLINRVKSIINKINL